MRLPSSPEEARQLHDEAHGAECRCAWVVAQERYASPEALNNKYQELLDKFMEVKGRSADFGVTPSEALEFFKAQGEASNDA